MEYLKIRGGNRLSGSVEITSAKNAVLPILACSVLTESDVRIKNCPRLSDVTAMLDIVRSIGGKADYDGRDVAVNCRDCVPSYISSDLTGGIRSSIFILGPILARFRKAAISYPGGCEIGLRPIDLHIFGLKKLNVAVKEENGMLVCDGSEMRAGEIDLDFPSVGATENIMMAAVFLDGTSVIRNAAREPEIVDLANFINVLGGRVYGAGSDTIAIEGVKGLNGGEYAPVPDRIAGGTFLTACAIAGGRIDLIGLTTDNVHSVTEKLVRAGCKIGGGNDYVSIEANKRVNAIHKIETQPYPGFPTDMQAQFVAMLSSADGYSVMVENLFENRYKYTVQLNKMGAKITVKDRIAVVKGVKRLHGGVVKAEDLRGGAALAIAALGAEGDSVITGLHHIDRGYYRIEESLASLGADVKRIENNR